MGSCAGFVNATSRKLDVIVEEHERNIQIHVRELHGDCKINPKTNTANDLNHKLCENAVEP